MNEIYEYYFGVTLKYVHLFNLVQVHGHYRVFFNGECIYDSLIKKGNIVSSEKKLYHRDIVSIMPEVYGHESVLNIYIK